MLASDPLLRDMVSEIRRVNETNAVYKRKILKMRGLLEDSLRCIRDYEARLGSQNRPEQAKETVTTFRVMSYFMDKDQSGPSAQAPPESLVSSHPDRRLRELEDALGVADLEKERLESEKAALQEENKNLKAKLRDAERSRREPQAEATTEPRKQEDFRDKLLKDIEGKNKDLTRENNRLRDQVEALKKLQSGRPAEEQGSPAPGDLARPQVETEELLARLQELEEENQEAKAEVLNLRENISQNIENTKSLLIAKINSLKNAFEERSKTPERPGKKGLEQSSSAARPKAPPRLDVMLLREITVRGQKRPAVPSYKSKSSNANKENEWSVQSGNGNRQKDLSRDMHSKQSGKASDLDEKERNGPLSERRQPSEDRLESERRSNRQASRDGPDLERLKRRVQELQEEVEQKEGEIDLLNKMLFEQKENRRAEEAAEDADTSRENIGDMSVRSEDLKKAQPDKLLQKVRALSLKQSELEKKILGAKYELEEAEKDKQGLQEEADELERYVEQLKGSLR